jgi:uncharacterized protein YyaL (SSP411 family)
MDTSEPSTNGTSASNLYRLSSLLNDDSYATKAKQTVVGFESETLQYPWLFASFMPSIVAGHLGLKGIVVSQGNEKDGNGNKKVKEFEKAPRGGLGTFARLDSSSTWLRERNGLLKDFGLDGKTKILICENGACREESTASEAGLVKEQPLEDLGGVAAALPVVGENKAAPETETAKPL